MSNIKRYINGNCITTIDLNNGTKTHETIDFDADYFDFSFAESCDMTITECCDGGCPFCYAGCIPKGKHGDLNLPFLDTLHPYTEIAINGNDLTHPDLVPFLERMKEKNIIVNMTVNQKHFERHYDLILNMLSKGQIKGIGVSLVNPTQEFIEKVKSLKTAVIHVIAGIVTQEELDKLSNNKLRLLVLGYKTMKNRGKTYYENGHKEEIDNKIIWLSQNLKKYFYKFQVVAFDNLALQQLKAQSLVSKKTWDEFYLGEDGTHTFFIDLVNKKFARTSISEKQYDLLDNIDDMFKIIKGDKEEIDKIMDYKLERTEERIKSNYYGSKRTTYRN